MNLIKSHIRNSLRRVTEALPELDDLDELIAREARELLEHLNTAPHVGEVKVALYPTYGYRLGDDWVIPLRGWTHQQRRLPHDVVAGVVAKLIECSGHEIGRIRERFQAFMDDSRSQQEVAVGFEADPARQEFRFPTSDLNGLIKMEIRLPVTRAKEILQAQAAPGPRLAINVASSGHNGNGHVRLIQPEGLSLVSDIDDTIKVTEIPRGKKVVLPRTFCREFEAAPGMAAAYQALGQEVCFHYVSGGPWQLFEPLRDFLFQTAGFPAGTFHLNYYPKNFLTGDTREALVDAITNPLGRTYAHKVQEISDLMERFPDRKFILVGDSGELDPEIYQHIRVRYSRQVSEVWIRDVLNDEQDYPHRLGGVDKVIKVDPAVRMTEGHYEKLSPKIREMHGHPYTKKIEAPGDFT
ncbi:MAG: phosphatidate phosphatase App1 family protein [Blastocatellia bacterium]